MRSWYRPAGWAGRSSGACATISDLPHVTENHLEVYDRDPDGVIVASPHVLHFEHAAAALAADATCSSRSRWRPGPPMPASSCGSSELRPDAHDPLRPQPHPWMEQAADWVRAGRIGAVRHVALHMSSALLDLFGGEPMLETEGHLYRPPPSTWADPHRAGGYGWGQLSHALAALFFVTDLEPESVHAAVHRSKTGVDDHDAAVLRFEGGAIGILSGAAGLPKHGAPQLDLRVYGEEGMLLLDVEEGRERPLAPASRRRRRRAADEPRRGFRLLHHPRGGGDRFIAIMPRRGGPELRRSPRGASGPSRFSKPCTPPRTPEERWSALERARGADEGAAVTLLRARGGGSGRRRARGRGRRRGEAGFRERAARGARPVNSRSSEGRA